MFSSGSPGYSKDAVDALLSAMSSSMPAKGALVTSLGVKAQGASSLFAPADHVHDFGKAFQRTRVAASASTSWTFPFEFLDAGGSPVLPIITSLAIESPANGAAFSDPVITALSSTGVTVQVRCQATGITIALGAFTLFGTAVPANTFLHISARNPSV